MIIGNLGIPDRKPNNSAPYAAQPKSEPGSSYGGDSQNRLKMVKIYKSFCEEEEDAWGTHTSDITHALVISIINCTINRLALTFLGDLEPKTRRFRKLPHSENFECWHIATHRLPPHPFYHRIRAPHLSSSYSKVMCAYCSR